MIILSKLEMEGFRSFKEPACLNFPEQGLILIRGQWKGRNVLSGTGKSSILLAISYALGFCSVPSTVLKNWDSKNFIVTLTLKNTETGDIYEFSRSPSLTIRVNGKEVVGGAEEKEAAIREIIKTPPELARVLTYREQRKPGMFINTTDAKKKEFLSIVLGLYEIENTLDSFLKEVNEFKLKKSNAETAVMTLQGVLSSSAIQDSTFEQARQTLETLHGRLKELLNGDTKADEFQAQLNHTQHEINKIQTTKTQQNHATYRNQAIKTDVLKLKTEIDLLSKNICPLCQREWDNCESVRKQKEEQIQKLLVDMQANITLIKNAEPAIALEPQLQAEMNRLRTAIAELKAPAQDAQHAYNAAKQHYQELESKKQNYINNTNRLAEYTSQLNQIDSNISLSELSIQLLGRSGFLGSIFDEILVNIEDKTNKLIVKIPNVDSFQLKFPSTKTTAKGTIKKSIDTEIYKNEKKVHIKSLSGGQFCAFELCSDLATAETIRERSGSKLGWIALDEAMDGLDIESKTFALEAITEQIKGQILIIDHATEVKEGFQKVIEVEYDGRQSFIAGDK